MALYRQLSGNATVDVRILCRTKPLLKQNHPDTMTSMPFVLQIRSRLLDCAKKKRDLLTMSIVAGGPCRRNLYHTQVSCESKKFFSVRVTQIWSNVANIDVTESDHKPYQ